MESGQASVRYNCTNRRQAKTLVVESGQASVRYNVGFKFHCRYVVVESGQASVRYNSDLKPREGALGCGKRAGISQIQWSNRQAGSSKCFRLLQTQKSDSCCGASSVGCLVFP